MTRPMVWDEAGAPPKPANASRATGYEVEITYESSRARMFTDRTTLSLDTYLGLTNVNWNGVHEIANTLDKIRPQIERWSATGGGVRIVTDADLRCRCPKVEESRLERANHDADAA